jgi:putative phosphoribosyl transferase
MNVPVGLIWIKKRERRPATIGSLVSSSRRQTELGEACGLDSRVPIMSKPNTTSYRSQSATQLGEVRDVEIPPVGLPGILHVPQAAYALVVFAHGSGSSRLSPRNTIVANALNRQRLATLLFDLLTPAEEADRANVFDIPLLATRLVDAARWIERQPALAKLPLGLFGASTGAAAAVVAAAKVPRHIGAVVSRGGRPDLAGDTLAAVRAPTLLIVGGTDHGVIELNEQALARLGGPKALVIVPGASHLFPEPGALEAVIDHAAGWFARHLAASGRKVTRNH